MKKLFLLVFGLMLILVPVMVVAAEIPLEWKAAENADGYRIYYGTDQDNLNYSVNTGKLTTWTVTDLKCGTTYYFYVKAYNEAGESIATNTAIGTTKKCLDLPTLPEGWQIDSLIVKPVE